jgi:hypothetical protein
VIGFGPKNIEKSFQKLFGEAKEGKGIEREEFLKALGSEGEPLIINELIPLLEKLVGKSNIKEVLSDNVKSEPFAKEVLGFEEVEIDDYEEGKYNEDDLEVDPD